MPHLPPSSLMYPQRRTSGDAVLNAIVSSEVHPFRQRRPSGDAVRLAMASFHSNLERADNGNGGNGDAADASGGSGSGGDKGQNETRSSRTSTDGKEHGTSKSSKSKGSMEKKLNTKIKTTAPAPAAMTTTRRSRGPAEKNGQVRLDDSDVKSWDSRVKSLGLVNANAVTPASCGGLGRSGARRVADTWIGFVDPLDEAMAAADYGGLLDIHVLAAKSTLHTSVEPAPDGAVLS